MRDTGRDAGYEMRDRLGVSFKSRRDDLFVENGPFLKMSPVGASCSTRVRWILLNRLLLRSFLFFMSFVLQAGRPYRAEKSGMTHVYRHSLDSR